MPGDAPPPPTGPGASVAPPPTVRLLLALLLLLSIANLLWARLGGGPMHWDAAVHLIESLNAHRVGEDPSRPAWKQFVYASWYYPPFVSYVCIPFYALLGESLFTALLVMNAFLLVLVASTYGVARRLFGREVALTAAFLIAMCPIAIEYSRDYMLDLPLASMVALSMFLIIASDGFRITRTSLLAGASLGCGLLTRWTFAFFLVGPMLLGLLGALRARGDRWVRLRNLLVALAVGAVIAAPWYTVRIVQILTTRLGELERGERSLKENALYYLQVLPQQVSWLLAIVLVAGWVFCLRFRRRPHAMLGAWFLGSYAVLSLVSFKQPRFSIPLLAPLVIMAAAGWIAWRDRVPAARRGRATAQGLALGLIAVQYLLVSFVPAASPVGRALALPLLGTPLVATRGPGGARWPQEEILRRIGERMQRAGQTRAVLRVLPDHAYFNRQTFEYAAALHRAPVVVAGISGFPMFADYVVAKTGDAGATTAEGLRWTESVIEESRTADPLFTEIDRLPLPDGSAAILFRVTPRSAPGASEAAVRRQVGRLVEQVLRKFLRPVEGSSLAIGGYDSLATTRGHIRSLRLRAGLAQVGDFAFDPRGLPARDLDVELSDVVLDPVALMKEDSLEILSVGGMRVRSVSVAARDLAEYIEASSHRQVAIDALSLEDGELRLRAHLAGSGREVRARLRLWSVGHRDIAFRFRELRLAGLPIHPAIANALTDAYSPVLRGFDVLSEFHIGELELSGGRMTLRDRERARP